MLETFAFTWLGFTNCVALTPRDAPFHNTVEPELKLEPCTDKVKPLPSPMTVGKIEEIWGAVFTPMVKGSELEFEPSVATATVAVLAVAIRFAGISAEI